MPEDERRRLAEAVREACLAAAAEAYQQGGYAGLCAEGRWELALDALRALPLDAVVDGIVEADESKPCGA